MPIAPELSGRALDERYELHEPIGEGAFGRVYRGFDRRLQRTVAVKVIKPWWAQDTAWVERFRREARLLARVSDPGIVRIYDIGDDEEAPYYVAELVDGESLAELLGSGPPSFERARQIAQELCSALGSAHSRGVVHCDVKPANVLLTREGRVKVGDFGVARLAGGTSAALTATVAGTPAYMSPEQARGRRTGPATDVYSAGVVLYEMLCGRTPFGVGAPVEVGLRHVQDEPPSLPAAVPAGMRRLVTRALSKEPADRFADGSEMAGALAALAPAPERRQDATRSRDAAPREDEPETIDLNSTHVLGASPTALLAPHAALLKARRRTRRRRLAAAAGLLALVCAALAALALLDTPGSTTVPNLRGVARALALERASADHLHPLLGSSYSPSAAGTVISQLPRAGARVRQGSSLRLVISAGPAPVAVPQAVGDSTSVAERALTAKGLRYTLVTVPSLGLQPGQVASQVPSASAILTRGSTVTLTVGEPHRWRTLTSFAGTDDGHSVPLQILGSRWRVVYGMSYRGTCLLLLVCFGPSAEVTNVRSGAEAGGFELSQGSSESHIFETGPGLYSLSVSGGADSARWSMTVEDYY